MQAERWQALMARLGMPSSLDTFAALAAAYSEPHRHYHTAAHIDACLLELDAARGQVSEPDRAELALWFHDAVYRPAAWNNERDSAAWAKRFLAAAHADRSLTQAVADAIMATRHVSIPDDPLSEWVVDIDLTILGYSPEEFARFEENIRREYSRVPRPLFRRKRARILKALIARSDIYSTDWFRSRYEQRARQNLRDAVAKLGG